MPQCKPHVARTVVPTGPEVCEADTKEEEEAPMKCKLCKGKRKVIRYVDGKHEHPPKPELVDCPECTRPVPPTFAMPRPKRELPN